MPCRLRNAWFRILDKFFRIEFFRIESFRRVLSSGAALGLASGLALALCGRPAWALMELGGIQLNSVQESNFPPVTLGLTSFTGYWAIAQSSLNPNAALFDTADSTLLPPVDLTKNEGNDSNPMNSVLFAVSADKAITPGTAIDVMVFASTTSEGQVPVPIAYFNNGSGLVSCNDYCDRGLYTAYSGQSTQFYYYGVPYVPNSSIQIGFYMYDLCAAWQKLQLSGGTISMCTNIVNNTPQLPANFGASFNLTVQLITVPTNAQWYPTSGSPTNFSNMNPFPSLTNLGNPAVTPAPSHLATLTVNFQNASPTSISCPTTTAQQTQAQIYTPGDTSISLNTGVFTMNPASLSTGQPAPAGAVVIVGSGPSATQNAPGPAVSATTPPTASEVLSRVQATGGPSTVGPGVFQNTQGPSDPNYYNLNFYMRDYAGYLTPGNSQCQLSNIQTSAIEGFLTKSSCFIATAAFRSIESPPVAMLRNFRDMILLHRAWGKSFVHWYYAWSPPAAEWLMLHPMFRYPVLLALIPLEIVAWLCLHPWLIPLLGLAGLGALGGGMAVLRRLAARSAAVGRPRGEA